MTIPEQVSTQVTIKGQTKVAEKDGGFSYKLECEAPLLFGPKKLPIIIWGCPDDGHAPNPGETFMAVLTRGKLSEKYDGSAYWHYQWRWHSRAAAGTSPTDGAPLAPSAQPEAPGAPAAPQAQPYDARNTSIERQVALKAAVEIASLGGPLGSEEDFDDVSRTVLKLANCFAAWLAGAPTTPQAEAQAEPGPAPEPTVALTKQEFVDWCKSNGLTTEKQVTDQLGMTVSAWLAAQPGRTLTDAAKALEAKP